jgi:hypothetical protein
MPNIAQNSMPNNAQSDIQWHRCFLILVVTLSLVIDNGRIQFNYRVIIGYARAPIGGCPQFGSFTLGPCTWMVYSPFGMFSKW